MNHNTESLSRVQKLSQFFNSSSNEKKIIAVGSGKGGSGKTVTAFNIAYLLAQEGYKTILVDGDNYAPNGWRREEGLTHKQTEQSEHFDLLELNKLITSNELPLNQVINSFRQNAPITENAKETIIDWYGKELLEELDLPHFLIYRDTINDILYEKKLTIDDLLINAGENLKIIFGLLETGQYPLAITPAEEFKEIISPVLSLDADKIVLDTSPGLGFISLYLFSNADLRYVVPNFEMAAIETSMSYIEGAIAYTLQEELKKLKTKFPESSIIEQLQEAQKLNKYENLTKTGLSLSCFIDKHGKSVFVKQILRDFSETTYFAINNVPHGFEDEAVDKLGEVIQYFKETYKIKINTIKNVPYISSLDDSLMKKATEQAVPFAYYLSQLAKKDKKDKGYQKLDKMTEIFHEQLKDLIKPVVN